MISIDKVKRKTKVDRVTLAEQCLIIIQPTSARRKVRWLHYLDLLQDQHVSRAKRK